MIDWKIPIIDFVNLLFLVTAGVLGYFLIDRTQEQEHKVALLQSLAGNLQRVSPGLDMHMASRLDTESGKLAFKVYMKNVSRQDIMLGTPRFEYLRPQGAPIDLTPADLTGAESMLAPKVDVCISFEVEPPPADAGTAQFSLQARIGDAYAQTLLLAVSELPDEEAEQRITQSIRQHLQRQYSVQLPLDASTHNTSDWLDFCMLSR